MNHLFSVYVGHCSCEQQTAIRASESGIPRESRAFLCFVSAPSVPLLSSLLVYWFKCSRAALNSQMSTRKSRLPPPLDDLSDDYNYDEEQQQLELPDLESGDPHLQTDALWEEFGESPPLAATRPSPPGSPPQQEAVGTSRLPEGSGLRKRVGYGIRRDRRQADNDCRMWQRLEFEREGQLGWRVRVPKNRPMTKSWPMNWWRKRNLDVPILAICLVIGRPSKPSSRWTAHRYAAVSG